MTDWVIWSEEHGAWWKADSNGYTHSLVQAGRYSEENAKRIEENANRVMYDKRSFNEVAIPDPLVPAP